MVSCATSADLGLHTTEFAAQGHAGELGELEQVTAGVSRSCGCRSPVLTFPSLTSAFSDCSSLGKAEVQKKTHLRMWGVTVEGVPERCSGHSSSNEV